MLFCKLTPHSCADTMSSPTKKNMKNVLVLEIVAEKPTCQYCVQAREKGYPMKNATLKLMSQAFQ